MSDPSVRANGPTGHGPWHAFLAFCVLAGGCHLALGLETAEELDETSTSMPMPDCTADTECDDANPCTDDTCTSRGCTNTNRDEVRGPEHQTAEDCQVAVCRDGMVTSDEDVNDVLVDGNTCTDDICSNGQPMNPPVTGGTPCATGVCNGEGACTQCYDETQCVAPDTCGGGGTPFECGCTPLVCGDIGLTCGNAPNGCIGALNCNTGTTDGNETDVDCGGPTSTCPRRCSAGLNCDSPSDCSSGVCTNNACVGN